MLNFIFTKWQIVKNEATTLKVSVFTIILYKTSKKVFTYLTAFFDVLLFSLFSPLIIIILLYISFTKKQTKQKTSLFIGLEHVIDKTTERALALEKKGFEVIFFSFEWTGVKCSETYNPKIVKYSKSCFRDTTVFIYYLLKKNPSYIEVYFEGGGARQLLSIILARLNNTLIIFIERGAFSNDLQNTMSLSYSFSLVNSMRLSNHVFYREHYTLEYLKKYDLDKKATFDFNKVKISEDNNITIEKKNNNILFLNGFAKFRRIDLVVKAFKIILDRYHHEYPDLKLILVGYRNEVEQNWAKDLIHEANIGKYTELHAWTSAPKPYFKMASFFLLPADLVFCNFSLLEAMENACVPIVADVRDANKIVEHEISGFIVPQNEHEISDYLIKLITNPKLKSELAQAARQKIKKDFDSKDRMTPVLNLIMLKYPYLLAN